MLTTKETNLLMREYVMKFGYEKINYTTLEEDLIECRFQLINNRTTGTFIEKYPTDELLQHVSPNQDAVKPHMTI